MTCPIRFRNKLALAIPLLFGCAEIDPIAPDVCGNHVVEPHVHEECDAPTGCGAPQTPAACRFTCEGGAACPDGYRCGVDHVCRKPSGTFEVIGQSELDFNRDLVVRDADGDGRDDVLRVAAERSFLEFYGDGGALETTSTIGQVPLVLPSAVIEDLNADGLREVAINVEGLSFFVSALAVYRLQPDRSFESTVYASLAIPGSSLRATRAQVLPPSFDDEMLVFVDDELIGVDRAVDPEPLAHGTSHTADNLEGMVAARFDEAAPCDHLAVVDAGGSSISIINPCIEAPGPPPEVRWRQVGMDPPDVSTVTLPGNVVDYTDLGAITFGYRGLRQALFAADWNSDGHVDLIAVPLDSVVPGLYVAYGQGDGTFHSAPVPTAGSDGLATTVDLTQDYPSVAFPCSGGVAGPGGTPVAFGTPVLGLADFDGDAGLDLVREDGIYLHGGPRGSATCGIGWLSVEISDFDGNGTQDVAASRFGSTSIDYLGGAGNGSFARTTINTPGLVMQLMAGDYDGDLVSDIAFFEAILGGEGIETSLGIAYGRGLGGAPELPVTVARIDGIAHLSSARFLRGDSISDLAVLARGDSSQALALVAGNSRRELSAPFLLNLAVGTPDPIPQSIDVVTTGSFGEGRGPIVAMTRDDFTQYPGNRNRPWLLSTSADEEITPALSSTYEDPQQGLFCEPAAFGFFASCPTAAVDLNSDGIDELVVFAGDASDPALGHAHTMVLGETGFDIANTLDMGQLRVEANDLNANPTRALVADLDGDGLRDILVDGVDVLASTSVLLAFYNNGNGTLTAPVTVPIPNIVREVALIELDGDPQVEIAVGTEISLDFWEATGERTLVPIEGEIEIRGVPPEPLHVVSGDVDGDGVQDLVMAGFYRFAVLRGIPITP